MVALVPRGWLPCECNRSNVISWVTPPDSFMASPQFACRIFFPPKKAFLFSFSLSFLRCSAWVHLLTVVRQSFHLALFHSASALSPSLGFLGQLLLGMCAVPCLKFLCLSWSGLWCVCRELKCKPRNSWVKNAPMASFRDCIPFNAVTVGHQQTSQQCS